MHYLPTRGAPSTMERCVTGVYRRRRLAVAVFIAIVGLDVAVTLLSPKKYESRMKVLVRNDRPELVVSAGTNPNSVSALPVGENEVNSEIELLRSYDILAKVVQDTKLVDQERPGEGRFSGLGSQQFERAVRRLGRELSVSPVRKSEVIQVSYSAKSPELAQAVLNDLASQYLDAHLRVHSSNGTEAFFQRQASHYQTEMREAEDRLNHFNRMNDIVSIETQKEVLLRKAADLEAELKQTEASRAEALSRVAELRQNLGNTSKRVVTQSRVLPNQYSVERLTTMMAELENRRTLALMKFQPNDRVVKEVEEEIANTKAAAERSAKLSAVEESTDRNPLRSELESELARGELQDAGLKARRDSLAVALDTFHVRLQALDGAALEHENLVRARAQAEQQLLLYTQKKEEARIADALDRQKIANVVIAESPMAEHIPSSPRPLLNLALGVLFATFAGLGLVLAGEFNRSSFSTPGELEAISGVVVLGAIPIERTRAITT